MPGRNKTFSAPHFEPFNNNTRLELQHSRVSGPLGFFNPTRARYAYVDGGVASAKAGTEADGQPAQGVQYKWRSRDNRKGRHTIVVDPAQAGAGQVIAPPITSSARATLKGIGRMFTYFPVWDVSYLVAQSFTWGSLIFVANGLFYWLPLVAPSTEFSREGELAGGISSFIGTVFFQVGVTLLMLEAVNTNRKGCFGWALEQVWSEHFSHGEEEGKSGHIRIEAARDRCVHHHPNKSSLFGYQWHHHHDSHAESAMTVPSIDATPQKTTTNRSWIWWPSWHDLTTHYFHEIGFISALIYFVAGTIFWIVGFCSLPNVFSSLSVAEIYGVFWTPDMVGSVGFIIGSYLIMLETQPNWYTPSPHILGWHIGLWNVIGSIGFALSASFGIADEATGCRGCLYQADLSTTWGSAAFLLASVIQWYESVNKHSVEKTGT